MLLLGIDVGSSSVKLSVVDAESGKRLGAVQYPETEFAIQSPQPGWAEQDPELWWDAIVNGCRRLFSRPEIDAGRVGAIGIAYQMHGLVMVDEQLKVLRPAIIWCDSRAAELGRKAFNDLGADYCFEHLLNSPGNFTAAKLRWVQANEPDIYARVHKIMLPGDYIAMRLTGEPSTTASGLSEGTLWDFQSKSLAQGLLDHWGIDRALIPKQRPNLGEQGQVSRAAAETLGLSPGVVIGYRAGDQPNNAFSLNVLEPGEVAATAGTSGVIYGVTDKAVADPQSRVNTFLHVNNSPGQPRNGVLLCVNGTGRLYSWLRELLSIGGPVGYPKLNDLASRVPVGSEGLLLYPFGNGAERIFQDKTPGGQINAIDFNRHQLGHLVRAAQEGIVFALNLGFEIFKDLGGHCEVIRVAEGNLFLSPVFAEAFANTTQTSIEVYDTDGAEGAARGAGLGCGYFKSQKEAFSGLRNKARIEPDSRQVALYQEAYQRWADSLPV
mgnify:CR=1 FL=1